MGIGATTTKITEYKFYAKNESGCHRGYKPLLLYCRSGDLPAIVKTEAGFGLTNFKFNLRFDLFFRRT
jgi:hypothetical protein